MLLIMKFTHSYTVGSRLIICKHGALCGITSTGETTELGERNVPVPVCVCVCVFVDVLNKVPNDVCEFHSSINHQKIITSAGHCD